MEYKIKKKLREKSIEIKVMRFRINQKRKFFHAFKMSLMECETKVFI
jgi:hypothetical protein